ncbi:hypothetical protein Z517_06450 [Fonsecaea pedrosoi CBS 271.37]|uniref:Uncharacterized protein n=1 Tax=Fonsecaea pedrosoi CBS 271.37 TaxID=1442368 RepID=A0A0D2GMR9_9EURO|nr:uncharacterized protein Z517_06450 [Fonsecaea pedrosoi CBS 271.37]KIW79835.1 hypothetical protein Z517_06450 [Fonsecaea pedrosoi CBS 271.37]
MHLTTNQDEPVAHYKSIPSGASGITAETEVTKGHHGETPTENARDRDITVTIDIDIEYEEILCEQGWLGPGCPPLPASGILEESVMEVRKDSSYIAHVYHGGFDTQVRRKLQRWIQEGRLHLHGDRRRGRWMGSALRSGWANL